MEQAGLLQLLYELDFWQCLAILAKALTYAATFAASGGMVFVLLFSRLISPASDTSIRRMIFFSALAGIALSLIRIALTSALLSGGESGLFDPVMMGAVIASGEGMATGVRCAALLLIAFLARRREGGGKGFHAMARFFYWLGPVMAATSFALVGHASEVIMPRGTGWLPPLLLDVHLLAAAFWAGSLWPLHHLSYREHLPEMAAIARRFGQQALVVVGGLVLVGGILLWLLVATLGQLLSNAYGQTFLIKLSSVALLLMFAAINKLLLTPALRRGDTGALLNLRRSIRAEIAIVGLILLITATLTTVLGPED